MDKLTEYREEVMNPKGRGLKFEIACIEDCIIERKKLGKDCSFEESLLKSFKRVAKKRGLVFDIAKEQMGSKGRVVA